MKTRNRVAATTTLAVLGSAIVAASASAAGQYNSWSELRAYEGSTWVASAKGTAGVDYNLDVIGGHITSYDPRPGGSPAYGSIYVLYRKSGGTAAGTTTVRGPNNYTKAWVDRFVTNNLDTFYDSAEMTPKACQDDKLQPDSCKSRSTNFNYKW